MERVDVSAEVESTNLSVYVKRWSKSTPERPGWGCEPKQMFCSAVAEPIRCWVDVPPIKWALCNETALGNLNKTNARTTNCRSLVCVLVWEVVEIK